MEIKWLLTDWKEPDLDRGYIIHRTKVDVDVKRIPMSLKRQVIRAADQYAFDADAAGIAITVDSWALVGMEFDV